MQVFRSLGTYLKLSYKSSQTCLQNSGRSADQLASSCLIFLMIRTMLPLAIQCQEFFNALILWQLARQPAARIGAISAGLDKEKLKVGMRVQAVWKEDYDERGEGPGDILYFKEIGK